MVTPVVAALVVLLPTGAIAKSAIEIAQIARETTVQINGDSNLTPGGSGAIVAKDGNTYTVLTANHVVCQKILPMSPCREDVTYTIRTHDGRDHPVLSWKTLYMNETDPDLAIVTFESSENYTVSALGDSQQAVVGSSIFVSGFPAPEDRQGSLRDWHFSSGLVTSRPSQRPQGYTLVYDAVTWGGMSGGPVFDTEGRTIGIHGTGESGRSFVSESASQEVVLKTGFNAAIPINTFMNLKDRLDFDVASLTVDTAPPTENSAAGIEEPESARDYNNRGLIQSANGNFSAAFVEFDRAIELDSQYSEAYFNRGNIYFQQGNYELALADYNQAVTHNPDFDLAYTNRALAKIRRGDYTGAIDDWTYFIDKGRGDALTYFHRGLAYSRLRNWSAVQADTTRAIQLEPNLAKAYNLRGDARVELGDSIGGIEDYTGAIDRDPSYGLAYNNRAVLLLESGDRTGACEDLGTAAQLLLEQGNSGQYQQVLDNLQQLRCP